MDQVKKEARPLKKNNKFTNKFRFTRKQRIIIYSFLFIFFVLWQIAYTHSLTNNRYCFFCHIVSPYAKAFEFSQHKNLKCGSCHPGKGLYRYTQGEIKAILNLILTPFNTNMPPFTSIDNSLCLSCHEEILTETIKSSHVRVRHKDFIGEKTTCVECHSGTGHKLKDRLYSNPGMNACMNCHNDSSARSDCSVCHIGRKKEVLSANLKAYGKFHPDNYLYIHGSEKTDKCMICHENNFCGKCHILVENLNIELPHPESWIYTHWQTTGPENIKACYACHDKKRCDSCHGLEMPHPNQFLKVHASQAHKFGTDNCLKCHDSRSCASCHIRHVHPNFGTQWTPEMLLKKL